MQFRSRADNETMVASARHADADEGFTLIELMVVVLIIAILLAIAIPTFLGARQRANDRAVQSNLRNAHTNELAFYTNHQVFSANVSELNAMDTSLSWTTVRADMALSPRSIFVVLETTNRPDDTVIVGGKAANGNCFWIRAVGDQDLPRFAENDCAAVPASSTFEEEWS